LLFDTGLVMVYQWLKPELTSFYMTVRGVDDFNDKIVCLFVGPAARICRPVPEPLHWQQIGLVTEPASYDKMRINVPISILFYF